MLIPAVYSFKNYREFLKAFYLAKKKESASYSYRRFSEDAGITSPNILKLVIDGAKNLTTNSILKFAKALSLGNQEKMFFEALVLENQAADSEEKSYYAKKLKTLHEVPIQKTVRMSKKLKLFEHPRLPALTTLIAGQPVSGTVGVLANKLGLEEVEVQALIQSLTGKGLLREENGFYLIDFDHAFFIEHPSDVQLKTYLRSQLKLSNRAFEKTYDKGSKFYSHTMGFRSHDMLQVVEDLKTFLSHLNSKYQSEPASDLLQINSQLFLWDKKILDGPV